MICEVRGLLREVPLIDGHNDTPWRYRKEHNNNIAALDFSRDTSQLNPIMKTDIPRLRAGGVGGQFWSVFIPDSWAGKGAAHYVREQINLVCRLVSKHPDALKMAYLAEDVKRIHSAGKIASLIGMEGGHSIEGSIEVLRELYSSGARYMTLTCSESNDIADSATDTPKHDGLSDFGKDVVREMNRMGMLVDLSHTSDETMRDVLDITEAPVIFSHSSARAVCDSPRNVPDEILKRVAENGGVVMVTFVTIFVSEKVCTYSRARDAEQTRLKLLFPDNPGKVEEEMKSWELRHPRPSATLADVAGHIDHIRRIAGIDHIGIGSDFGGFKTAPVGLEDVSCFPALLGELLRCGYTREDVEKIAGRNILRVLRTAEEVAARIQD